MELWLLLLLAPLLIVLVSKYYFRDTISNKEMALQAFSIVAVVTICFSIGSLINNEVHDTEILNGAIISKDREHGQYVRSYSCRCMTTCSGSGTSRICSRHCQTCYENRYTVKWYADTTIGRITFDVLDRSSISVYNAPDPNAYTMCKPGEPASKTNRYINYVRAVPQSLFNDDSEYVMEFDKDIPDYPTIYGHYKVNRVITIGEIKLDPQLKAELNSGLGDILKTLGPLKQVNIIMIITDITDPNYKYAVERAWMGGKKNDVVLFVGIDGTKIIWADVMTWAKNIGNEVFQVMMRDALLGAKELTTDILPHINRLVQEKYDRPTMKQFEHLADEIIPPTWVIVLCSVLGVSLSIALTWIFHKNEVN